MVDPSALVNDGPTGTMTFIQDLVRMLNKTGVKCPDPILGPTVQGPALARMRDAAHAAEQKFGKP
jgi:hypothetical protein